MNILQNILGDPGVARRDGRSFPGKHWREKRFQKLVKIPLGTTVSSRLNAGGLDVVHSTIIRGPAFI